jgi:hypothetical protein
MGNTGKQCRKECNNNSKGMKQGNRSKWQPLALASAHCSCHSTNTPLAHEAHPCWKEYVIASDATVQSSTALQCRPTTTPHSGMSDQSTDHVSPTQGCYSVTHTTLSGQCLSQALLAYLVCPLVCPTLVSGPNGCQTFQTTCVHSYCCGIQWKFQTHKAQLPNTTQTPGQHQSCTLTQCALSNKHVAAPVSQSLHAVPAC